MDSQSTIPTESLPAWMLQAKRGTDWGMLITLVFAIVISGQLWTGADINLLNANENHTFMISDIAQSLREGRLYPRWSAYAQQGHGAPIPHFYSVGAAYVAAGIEILFTNDSLLALRAIYTLALLCASSALYAFITRWMGAKQGLIASTIFLTSAYFSLTAPYITGDLYAVAGYALLCALMWAVSRHLTINSNLDAFMVSLITTALILTDLRITLLAFIILPVLLVWHRYIKRQRATRRVTVAILMGVIMSAFFLLPAITERDAVIWVREIVQPPRFYLNLQDLIAPLQFIDRQSLNQVPQFTLGFSMWILIIGGFIAGLIYRKQSTLPLLMLGIMIVFIRMLEVIFPEQTWITGILVICGAITGSAVIYFEKHIPQPYRIWFMPILFTLIILTSIPVLSRPVERVMPYGSTSIDQLSYQREGFGTPVLPAGWELPSSLPAGRLTDVLHQPENEAGISKISIDQLLGNVQITSLSETNHHARFQIDTPQPLSMIYRIAHFPGWSATINNTPISTTRDRQNGFIALEIPAVRNGNLDIFLSNTPVQTLGWVISSGMFIMLIYLTRRRIQNHQITPYQTLTPIPESTIYRLMPVMGVFIIFAILMADSHIIGTLSDDTAMEKANVINVSTSQNMNLIGYELTTPLLKSGETLAMTLFWQSVEPQEVNMLVQLHLRDTNNRTITQPVRHPGGIPTKRWTPEYYITDLYRIPIPSNTPAGSYQVTIDLFACESICERFEVNSDNFVQTITLPEVVTIE